MPRKFTFWTCCLIVLASCTFAVAAEEWTDVQGNKFRGEPVEVLGPLALFRTSKAGGIKPAWRFLTQESCVRFYEKVKDKPARATDWMQAQSSISHALIDKVKRVQDDKLVDADLKGRPEPEFFILFFADNGEGKSWDMLGHSIEPFNKLQAAFPGQVEGLFFGIHHSATDHNSMATRMKVPWLVAEYREQFRHLPDILEFAPTEDGDFAVMVISRDGVPIYAAQSPKDDDLNKIFTDLTGLLDLLRPENPRSWPDRLYYQWAVQPVIFAHGHSDPVLVGNPLVAEGLRQRKIYSVDATIAVNAGGHVTDVTVKPGGDVPPNMVGPLGDALKRAVFVPAVDSGKYVDGTYAYQIRVPH
jgi:hypothetical protein